MAFFVPVLTFAILLGVVVVVHELGHLIIARMNGVFCEAFSIGFGPVLFSRKDKKGTEWRVSLLPLGGYVKMFGDADATSVTETIPDGYTEEDMARMSAHRKKPWQRLLISLGGPLANLIFSVAVFFALAVSIGMQEPDNSVTVVSEDTLAYKSGLRTGDIITSANGIETKNFFNIVEQVKSSVGKKLVLKINRENQNKEISIDMFEKTDGKIKPIQTIGITTKGYNYKKVSIWEAAKLSLQTTYVMATQNMKAIFKIATGSMSSKNVGGIISIFNISSASAEAGVASFITMIAMISVILGAINLLPIPVLDGGSVVISGIEWIIGKPLHKTFINAIFIAGLIIVVGLMLLGIWNDLVNIKFFSWLESIVK